MSKHTPGPWSHHERGSHPYPFVCAAPIATEYGEDRFVVAYLVGADTTTNARLIASAPDLLRVAELLVDWLNEDEGAHKLCDAARAAIAKAEGRS